MFSAESIAGGLCRFFCCDFSHPDDRCYEGPTIYRIIQSPFYHPHCERKPPFCRFAGPALMGERGEESSKERFESHDFVPMKLSSHSNWTLMDTGSRTFASTHQKLPLVRTLLSFLVPNILMMQPNTSFKSELIHWNY